MIDTHCHLLPSLDDGPPNDAEALALADELVKAGVTTIVCTPHFNRRYPTDHAAARKQLVRLRRLLPESGLDVRLELAAEVGPAAALDSVDEELLPRAIGGRSLLVELEPSTPAAVILLLCDRVAEIGLTPVLAHPERCRAVQRDSGALTAARDRGALVQVVASSLAGSWGRTIARTAWALVASGRADLVGSDAHRAGSQRPLARVLHELEERLGPAEAGRLLVDTPRSIVATD